MTENLFLFGWETPYLPLPVHVHVHVCTDPGPIVIMVAQACFHRTIAVEELILTRRFAPQYTLPARSVV